MKGWTSSIIKNKTSNHRVLSAHVRHSKGTKTVCVSSCLSFFGIKPETYSYTSSEKNIQAYIGVLRRNGYSVRSKKSEFKAMNGCTMTTLRRNMKKSKYTAKDYFVVSGYQSKKAHLMVLDGNGETVIDTAKGMKWRVRLVSIVE